MDTKRFLAEAPTAKRVRLPARVVIGRGAHSLHDVEAIVRAGTYVPEAGGAERPAELEVSGVVLARGKVVRKGGRLFFKVTELGKGQEGEDR